MSPSHQSSKQQSAQDQLNSTLSPEQYAQMEEERKETVQRALFERNEDELRKADDRVKDMVAQHSLTVPEPTRDDMIAMFGNNALAMAVKMGWKEGWPKYTALKMAMDDAKKRGDLKK